MTDIIIKDTKDDVLIKGCHDFIPLDDGTLSGERKYCNLSFQCKQVDMAADYVRTVDPVTGEDIGFDYLCTGKYALIDELSKDEEAE